MLKSESGRVIKPNIMDKLAFKLILIFFVIIGYVLVINIFASLISITQEREEATTKTIIRGGTIVEIGVGELVSVSITRRPHWYGRGYSQNGKEFFYLFYFIKLPMHIKGYYFWIFHFIFLISLILFIILIFIKKKNYQEEEFYAPPLPESYEENKELKGGERKMKLWAKILIIAIVSFFGFAIDSAGFTLLVLLIYLEFIKNK